MDNNNYKQALQTLSAMADSIEHYLSVDEVVQYPVREVGD